MAKDNSGLILLIAGGAVAWYGYTQGWFASFFTPAAAGGSATTLPAGVNSIPTNVMSLGVQISYANAMLAAGQSVAAINSSLQSFANSYSFAPNCASGSAWAPFTFTNGQLSGGGCMGGLVPTTTTTTPCAAPNTLINGVCTPPATSPANPPTITQYSGPSDVTPSGVALATALVSAAGSTGPFNIDQWSFYAAQVPGPPINTPSINPSGVVSGSSSIPGPPLSLTSDQIASMLNAAGSGATAANRSSLLMTAGQFVGLLAATGTVTGLSGLGNIGFGRRIFPVPIMLVRGRGFGRYDLGDLRRAR